MSYLPVSIHRACIFSGFFVLLRSMSCPSIYKVGGNLRKWTNERMNGQPTPDTCYPFLKLVSENRTAVEWNSKVWPKRGCCVTFEVSCKGWRLNQLSSYNCAAVTPSTRWEQCLKPYSFAYVQKGHLAFGKRSRLCHPSSSLSVFLIQHGGLTKKPQIRFYGHFNHFQLYNEGSS